MYSNTTVLYNMYIIGQNSSTRPLYGQWCQKIARTVNYKKQNKNDYWRLVETKKHLVAEIMVKFGP